MSKHMRQEVRVAIDENNPAIVRDEDLCVECRLCAGICNEYVGVNNAYDLAKTADDPSASTADSAFPSARPTPFRSSPPATPSGRPSRIPTRS